MGVRLARLAFVGTSHAAFHLRKAAEEKGFQIVPVGEADVVFISEDTPIAADGTRDEAPIRRLVHAAAFTSGTIVVTSQVTPGFTRNLRMDCYCQTETLRMKDAEERARKPEMMIVGCEDIEVPLPEAYVEYLWAFGCPILRTTLEEAEFSKIAFNMALAMQVDYANRMKAACDKIGADWDVVKQVVHGDKRIGPHAYLDPGRWQDSLHLLRDAVTLKAIEDAH